LAGIPAALADVDNNGKHEFDMLASGLLFVYASLTLPRADNRSESASNKIWELYGTEADKHDKELTETWKEETGGMLIFVRLLRRPGRGIENKSC
jgi:hypothetical protein